MHGADHVMVAKVGDQDDGMMGQDAGEDLRGPLVGERVAFGAGDAGLLKLRGVILGDVAIKALATVAIAAAGDRDDDAAFVQRCLRRGHALDSLVDVLVKGVPTVGGDGDIAGYGLDACQLPHKGAACLVRVVDIARKRSNDLMVAVEHYVEDESQARHLGRGHHVLVDLVAGQDAGAGVGIVDKLTVVVVHDGLV